MRAIDSAGDPITMDHRIVQMGGWGDDTLAGFECEEEVAVDETTWEMTCTIEPTEEKSVLVEISATDYGHRTSYRRYLVDTTGTSHTFALGDSYSAGEGLEPFLRDRNGFDGHDNRCHRSTHAYPTMVQPNGFNVPLYHRASGGTANPPVDSGEGGYNKYGSDSNHRKADEVEWAFWACAGAVTANVSGQPQTNPDDLFDDHAQLDMVWDAHRVDNTTDLVTISIGGNDMGFADWLGNCAVAICNAPPVRDVFWSEFERRLDSLRMSLRTELRGIQQQTWNARLVVLGYPHLFTDSTLFQLTCTDRVAHLLFQGEMDMFNEANDQLNEAIRTVAETIGAEFVDVRPYFGGHGVCDLDPWINGPALSPTEIVSDPGIKINDQSFHPKAAGQRAYAAAVNNALRHARPAPVSPRIAQGERCRPADGWPPMRASSPSAPPGPAATSSRR